MGERIADPTRRSGSSLARRRMLFDSIVTGYDAAVLTNFDGVDQV
jgi:hypothetical protein